MKYLNTIQYDNKLYQVKTTIVNCTDVWIKGLKIQTDHRRYLGIARMYVAQI